jgi:hypothetical protein
MKRLTAFAAGALLVLGGLAACATGGGSGGGWITLFDGSDLKHWYQVGGANWRIEGDTVVADKKEGKDNGFLVTNAFYRDFQLHAEFWVSDDANSGVYMRCGNPEVFTDKICYEANIFDQRKDPTYGTGAIVRHVEVSPMPKVGGKWNTYEITAKGRDIIVVLNGQQTAKLRSEMFMEGPITLQHGAGTIKFRKVAIKPL